MQQLLGLPFLRHFSKCFFFISFIFFNVPPSLASDKVLSSPYERLEKTQSFYRKAVRYPWPLLRTEQILTLGKQGPAVVELRQRLCATQELADKDCKENASYFDKRLQIAVELFQERHGLKQDGIVGAATREALNVSPEQRLHQIQINLKRWSRFNSITDPIYIWVNVPDHRLRLVKNHQALFTCRVIVGKLSQPTPEINSKITHIVLNPYWTVPPGIARRSVIPKASQDSGYLQRNRIRIIARATGQELNAGVDWTTVQKNPSHYFFRQDPGPHNALGQIKFIFANPHLVYLHDTPTKTLFDAERRLFSSGCVRLENPLQFLRVLEELIPNLKKEASRITLALETGRTTVINLKPSISIHITYITAWVDKNGKLHFWDDVYRRDPILPTRREAWKNDLPQPT